MRMEQIVHHVYNGEYLWAKLKVKILNYSALIDRA